MGKAAFDSHKSVIWNEPVRARPRGFFRARAASAKSRFVKILELCTGFVRSALATWASRRRPYSVYGSFVSTCKITPESDLLLGLFTVFANVSLVVAWFRL